jgi:hypothetical protein
MIIAITSKIIAELQKLHVMIKHTTNTAAVK